MSQQQPDTTGFFSLADKTNVGTKKCKFVKCSFAIQICEIRMIEYSESFLQQGFESIDHEGERVHRFKFFCLLLT